MSYPKGKKRSLEEKLRISQGLQRAYGYGRKKPISIIPWNKGKTKDEDARLLNISEKQKNETGTKTNTT